MIARLFKKKKRTYIQHAPKWYENGNAPRQRASTSMMPRPASRSSVPGSPRTSVATAREVVRARAESSRAEIGKMVEEDRAAVAALVADSVKASEEQLRSEVDEKLKAQVGESVKSEVARTIAQLRSKPVEKPAKAAAKSPAKPAAKAQAAKASGAKSKSRPSSPKAKSASPKAKSKPSSPKLKSAAKSTA